MSPAPFKNVVSISQPAIPLTLIGGIRRRLGSIEKDPWDANQELMPEAESESPSDGNRFADVDEARQPGSNEITAADYYKILLREAIEHGGRCGDHQMSIPWLRMTLAGLEFKRIDPESMWYGMDTVPTAESQRGEATAFDDLFPSARQAFASVR